MTTTIHGLQGQSAAAFFPGDGKRESENRREQAKAEVAKRQALVAQHTTTRRARHEFTMATLGKNRPPSAGQLKPRPMSAGPRPKRLAAQGHLFRIVNEHKKKMKDIYEALHNPPEFPPMPVDADTFRIRAISPGQRNPRRQLITSAVLSDNNKIENSNRYGPNRLRKTGGHGEHQAMDNAKMKRRWSAGPHSRAETRASDYGNEGSLHRYYEGNFEFPGDSKSDGMLQHSGFVGDVQSLTKSQLFCFDHEVEFFQEFGDKWTLLKSKSDDSEPVLVIEDDSSPRNDMSPAVIRQLKQIRQDKAERALEPNKVYHYSTNIEKPKRRLVNTDRFNYCNMDVK